jgi:hypothetical protein
MPEPSSPSTASSSTSTATAVAGCPTSTWPSGRTRRTRSVRPCRSAP